MRVKVSGKELDELLSQSIERMEQDAATIEALRAELTEARDVGEYYRKQHNKLVDENERLKTQIVVLAATRSPGTPA